MKQWYYAKGGQKFGPFQKSHIEELYNKNEISATDLVWEEGTPEWVAANKVFATPTATPPPLADAPPTDGKLHPFSCIERGWNLVWKYPAHLIGGVFIAGVMIFICMLPAQIGSFMIDPVFAKILNVPPEMKNIGWVLYAVGLIITLLTFAPLAGGMIRFVLNTKRTEKPELGDLFYPFKKFSTVGVQTIFVYLLTQIIVFLLVVCLMLPFLLLGIWLKIEMIVLLGAFFGFILAIWVSVYFTFSLVAVVDTQPGIIGALKRSYELVKGNWWRVFGLTLLLGCVMLLGYCACLVGMIISAPIVIATFIYAYEDLVKLKK